MVTISLDVHKDRSQVCVSDARGKIVFEAAVETKRETLQSLVGGLRGPKRVVFEEGPLSGLLQDWLGPVADEVVSCDPTRNALIACAEDSNDQNDARRLAELDRNRSLRPVYIPPAPYRELRSLLVYEERLTCDRTCLMNRAKALCRRAGVPYRGKGIYRRQGQAAARQAFGSAGLRWQFDSLCRRWEELTRERLGTRRMLKRLTEKFPVVERLQTIPGVGPTTARTLLAWVVDPNRFTSRWKLSSYAGLGLGQGWTNWQPVGPCRASKRGQRALKRVLFLAARANLRGAGRLAQRYRWRVEVLHWEDRKAIRDLARTLLFVACRLWRKGGTYREDLVPRPPDGAVLVAAARAK